MTRALALAAALAACHSPSRLDPIANHVRELFRVAVPADRELAAELAAAVAIKQREDLDRALDALEPGELIEHATLSQRALEAHPHSLDDLLRVGDDLFAYQFRPENGLGNGLGPELGAGAHPAPNLRRVHQRDFGGPDALACADCHSVGGDDGAGALTQNTFFRGDGDRTSTADVRNPPALLGLGPVEALATEMTAELAVERTAALARAASSHAAATATLSAKGLAFGALVAQPDGTLDTSRVTGVSPDLIVRPFGWKGHQARLRGMVRESFRVHMGIVAMIDQRAVRDGALPGALGDGPWYDVDRDGVTIELDDGMLSTMVAYLAQLEVPASAPPADPALRVRFERGRDGFARVGCAGCHVPALPLTNSHLVTGAEQPGDPLAAPIDIDVARAGRTPKIERAAGGGYVVPLFSDLRRHDLGPELAAPFDQPATGGAIPARAWLTRPLWGLADTAPYLHDGRAPTIEAAILAHGGEAAAARAAFAALDADARGDLLVFLSSLTRTPRVAVP